jgi:DNA-binding NtrC family response regulator
VSDPSSDIASTTFASGPRLASLATRSETRIVARLVFETIDFAVQGGQNLSLCLVVMSEDGVATCPLPKHGELIVGRAAGCDVRLDGHGVSRRHVALRVGARVELVDLGSRNGTLLGDRRLTPHDPALFSVGDTARIGDTLLMLQATTARIAAVRFSDRAAFDARLERELYNAGKNRSKLALLHVTATLAPTEPGQAPPPPALPERQLAEALRPIDLLYANGTRGFEVVLVDVTPTAVAAAIAGLRQTLTDHGFAATIVAVLFPKDGVTRETLERAAESRLRAAKEKDPSAPLVDTAALKRMVPILERVAGGMINVLILGETGVGKEVLAHAIHSMSPRANAKLVCLNCSALTDTLHESELFGHERGAFTGAVRDKAGLLETANGGTVFLDEVGEMPMPLQAKFLRVLEQKEVTRVGAVQPHPIDVRIVAATNRDLEVEVEAGRFRRDLYFRLNGVSVLVPPLRDRLDEIEPLARSFVLAASRASLSPPPRISPEVLEVFRSYSWPGNIRELRNLIDRAVLLCADGEIRLEHLPMDKLAPVSRSVPRSEPDREDDPGTHGIVLSREQERARVIDALRRCSGNQTKAAELLNMSRRTLVSRISEFGLPRPRKQT